MIKPLLFGYVRITGGDLSDVALGVGVVRTAMLRFATREGFSLAQVFVETDSGAIDVALASLLEATRFTTITGVLVLDRGHLGDDTRTQHATRTRIQTTAGCPVITG